MLLYGFILLVVRSATKGMEQAPQESIILGAAEAAQLRAEHGLPPRRLLVVASPELQEGQTIEVAAPTTVGRDAHSGIRLDRDEFASATHARIEPRRTEHGSTTSARRTDLRERKEAEASAAREGR